MTSLDRDLIRQFAHDPKRQSTTHIEVFTEIDSTNSYLMQATAPEPGSCYVAATRNQTAGRGRHGKTWQSPPDSGLCLSTSYTFQSIPKDLPALTLAVGLGAIDALEALGARGIELKWPNDLIAQDGKLAGILTEVKQQSNDTVTVVTGIGVNVDLPDEHELGAHADLARQVIDLKRLCDPLPSPESIAGALINQFLDVFDNYEICGFMPKAERWSQYDWLRGRKLTIDTTAELISGVGCGVDSDGALLVDTLESGVRKVSSGTIVSIGEKSVAS
jgi:BirA family biotin operon repressor/biotin-[acetyl-CoA-carboxylase] ligase